MIATGIYIDDTPIQMRAVGFNPDDTLPKTFDLDRIEVESDTARAIVRFIQGRN